MSPVGVVPYNPCFFVPTARKPFDDLQELIKEINKAITQREIEELKETVKSFFSYLVSACEELGAEKCIVLAQQVEELLGERLTWPAFQKIVFPFLIISTRHFTKIILKNPAQFDVSYLSKLKNIFDKHFSGTHFAAWTETITDFIFTKSVQEEGNAGTIMEKVTYWALLKTYFSPTLCLEQKLEDQFKNERQKVSLDFLHRFLDPKNASVDLLRQLERLESPFLFFYEVMREALCNRLEQEELNIVAAYIGHKRIPVGKAAEILCKIETSQIIDDIGWVMLLAVLFKKVRDNGPVLFFDVWSLGCLFSQLKKKFPEIGIIYEETYQSLFENKVHYKLLSKSSIDFLYLTPDECERIKEQMEEMNALLEHPDFSQHQKDHLSGILLGVGVIFARSLKGFTLEFLKKIAPKLSSGPELDQFKLSMVLELLSMSDQNNETVLTLQRLKLFKPERIAGLLRNWNQIFKEFSLTCKKPYFLVFALSQIFGIDQREFVLYLTAQPISSESIENLKRDVLQSVVYKIKPNERELAKIQQRVRDPVTEFDRIAKRIEWVKYLLCIYDFSNEFTDFLFENIIKNIRSYDDYYFFSNVVNMFVFSNYKNIPKKFDRFLHYHFSVERLFSDLILLSENDTINVFIHFDYLVELFIGRFPMDAGYKNAFYLSWISAITRMYLKKMRTYDINIKIKKNIHLLAVASLNKITNLTNKQQLQLQNDIKNLNSQFFDQLIPDETTIVKTKKRYKVQ